jgi:hypothetical protein
LVNFKVFIAIPQICAIMRKSYAAGIADLLRDAAILHYIAYRLAASVLTARHKYRISDYGRQPSETKNLQADWCTVAIIKQSVHKRDKRYFMKIK